MKLKNIAAALAVIGTTLASSSASAYIIQDGWSLNNGVATTSGIGHLDLSGGIATVSQQVNASGNPFVGAQFSEFGSIFSVTYVPENFQGFNDFGPSFPITNLQVVFSGLSGVVTAYDSGTGALDYRFNADAGSILLRRQDTGSTTVDPSDDTFTNMATLAVKDPSGGDLNNFFGQAQTNGQSTLLLNFLSFLNGFDIDLFDPYSLGIPTTYSDPDDLFLQIQTTNKIGVPASAVGACSFNEDLSCKNVVITSNGSADLLRIPEPGTLALAGIALVGLAGLRRRRESK